MQNIILVKDQDGNIKQATDVTDISRKDITKQIAMHTAELQRWQNALDDYDRLAGSDSTAENNDGHVKFAKDTSGKIVAVPVA